MEHLANGWVNFPIDDPAWANTNEGGMLVKLVVCDNRENDQFGMCCGAYVVDHLCESFIADDRLPCPPSPANFDSMEAIEAEQRANQEWEAYHFPNLHCDKDLDGLDRYASRPYLAVLVLGTTGWSGWNKAEGRYWECRYDDLTEEGKVLYRQIAALYQGCDLHLLTFLDT